MLDGVLFFLKFLGTSPKRLLQDTPQIYEELRASTIRNWHDGLYAISDVPTTTAQGLEDKLRALHYWREYGKSFGLNADVRVVESTKPSTPSNETLYWKIQRKCFYPACACSPGPVPCHAMRVCKGCYRVLYCNARCQSL